MKNFTQLLLLSAGIAGLTACSTGTQNPAPIVNGNGVGSQATTTQGLGEQASLNGSNVVATGNKNTIYFALNKSGILSQYQGVVDQYASYLTNHPAAKVKISGYTDKSGSRSWNLSLSQMRAKSVAKALEKRGVKRAQVQIVGYGEEYPQEACQAKAVCWQERRVVLNPVD